MNLEPLPLRRIAPQASGFSKNQFSFIPDLFYSLLSNHHSHSLLKITPHTTHTLSMFTSEQIIEIAGLPESAFRFKCHVDALISLYKWVREQWTSKAIAEHRSKYNLDCRTTEGKLRFALTAAQEMSQGVLPPAVTQIQPSPPTEDHRDIQTSRILCQAIAFLKPVPPTNGLEKSPSFRIMGEPIYWDELVRNYKQLRLKWHPDQNPNSSEAEKRFKLITQIYTDLKSQWFQKYSPLIPIEKIGQHNLQLAMSKQFAWSPESFWE